ncbi:hypothetical protein Daus18300_005040 [Diaporthe australafricana]|uniref:RRM domain-containing protein n=1 Tax=Diaporthe australafricana TaxID=127596 RepID=A0ABR3X4Y5_9PEZI
MAGSRASRRRRKQEGQQGQPAQPAQLQESTTYSELLRTTIPENSNQNPEKVAQTLGIVQNVFYPSASAARDDSPEATDDDMDQELASQLKNTALYHAAIKPDKDQTTNKTKMGEHDNEAEANNKGKQPTIADGKMLESNKTEDKKAETPTAPADTNRNCAVTIWNMPDGTTEANLLEAITAHKPVGKIYACDVYVIPGPNNVPPAMSVAIVQFMRPESATRLLQIGADPAQCLDVGGKKARMELSARPKLAYLLQPDASRVIIFRGPRAIVNPVALRKLWGFKEQTERIVVRKMEDGKCELEWRFCSFGYNAEPALVVFNELYGKRKGCSAEYGVDPCA